MRAIRPKKTSGSDGLELEDFPTPVPGAHQVMVRAEAIESISSTSITAAVCTKPKCRSRSEWKERVSSRALGAA
jgi:hypothetical protein